MLVHTRPVAGLQFNAVLSQPTLVTLKSRTQTLNLFEIKRDSGEVCCPATALVNLTLFQRSQDDSKR